MSVCLLIEIEKDDLIYTLYTPRPQKHLELVLIQFHIILYERLADHI